MTGNNPMLDLVNDDVHTKFGLILSIRSQDIERKRCGVRIDQWSRFELAKVQISQGPVTCFLSHS